MTISCVTCKFYLTDLCLAEECINFSNWRPKRVEETMLDIEGTENSITLETILAKVSSSCELDGFAKLVTWIRSQSFNGKTSLGLKNGCSFLIYVKHHTDIIPWLIYNNFAKVKEIPFVPINLVIESKEELAHIWHRLAMNKFMFNKHYNGNTEYIKETEPANAARTWNKVNDLAMNAGLLTTKGM